MLAEAIGVINPDFPQLDIVSDTIREDKHFKSVEGLFSRYCWGPGNDHSFTLRENPL